MSVFLHPRRHAGADGAPVALLASRPNPMRGEGVLRFTLPTQATVSLSIYDLQGRQVMKVLERETYKPGAHEIDVDAKLLPSGLYVARFEAGAAVVTRKFVVAR